MNAKQAKATMEDIAVLTGQSIRKVREDKADGLFSMGAFWSVARYVYLRGESHRMKGAK